MKICELYDEDRPVTQLDKKLRQWTYDGIRSLFPNDIQSLIKKYPFDGGKIYRGLNFKSKDQYDKFMSTSNGGTIYSSDTWSSWTPEQGTANQFSITWPTYHLNMMLMRAEDEKSKNRDHMIGYAGLILSMNLPANVVCDVSKSNAGAEHEIIVPAGNYKIKIVEQLRPFKQTITTQESANDILLSMKKLDTGNEFNIQKFRFITHNFPNFSDEAKDHLGKLIKIPAKPLVSIDHYKGSIYVGNTEKLHIHDNITYEMIGYYPLLNESGKERIRKFVDHVMKLKIVTVGKYLKENDVDLSKCGIENDSSRFIENIVSPELANKYSRLFKPKMASSYKNLDDMVKQINGTNSRTEQEKLIDDYKNKMITLISNISKV